MTGNNEEEYRYFLTYSGLRLPLNLVGPLEANAIANRNTYVRATYDSEGRLACCEKLVYGEVELRHPLSQGTRRLCEQTRRGGGDPDAGRPAHQKTNRMINASTRP